MKRRPQDIVIACDMDDTIEYLLQSWIKWLNNQYGFTVDFRKVYDWNVTNYYPFLTEEQVFEPLFIEEFWKTVKPMPDAIKYIEKLIAEGFQFYIVTSTHYKTLEYKVDNILRKYFPFIDTNYVVTLHNKQLFNCDILIDDGTHNIIGPYYGLLMNSPHNIHFDVSSQPHVERVFCWKQIYNKVHQILDL